MAELKCAGGGTPRHCDNRHLVVSVANAGQSRAK